MYSHVLAHTNYFSAMFPDDRILNRERSAQTQAHVLCGQYLCTGQYNWPFSILDCHSTSDVAMEECLICCLIVFLSVLKRIVFLYFASIHSAYPLSCWSRKILWKYLLSLFKKSEVLAIVQISSLKHSLLSILCMSIVYLKMLHAIALISAFNVI